MIASQCGMLEVVQQLLRFHARVDVFDEVKCVGFPVNSVIETA